MNEVDVFATDRCPVGRFCESCGDSGPTRDVAAAATTVGALCLTLCERCDVGGMVRQIPAGTAAIFVATHCSHLGITVDQMAAVLAGREAEG